MKKLLFVILIFLNGSLAFAQNADSVRIIPKPAEINMGAGVFTISHNTSLIAKTPDELQVAGMFNYFFYKKYGFKLKINSGTTGPGINLNTRLRIKLPDEGYQLVVTSSSINVVGQRSGIFYGVQSLLQLIKQSGSKLSVSAITINDEPNFPYRGVMLDVCRHFYDGEEVKKILDVMASLKLNRFHWHLTDDQGWRLEIKKYPKLAQISAWRDSTIIGSYGDFRPFVYDGQRTGGFYTQAQAKEIVKYAAERNITIIPEIEMPGHSSAALAAYPGLGNGAGPYKVPGFWGVHTSIYNPGDQTFQFLEDVLTEVMAIFPGKYIHIGGDEVPKNEWKASPIAQKIIKDEHLKDEDALQSWFINRIEKFLNKNGRSLIGWDEILEGGLTRNATVMSWRGEKGGIQAAQESHNVIMTPGEFMYIDKYQSKDSKTEPLAIGGFLPVEVVYNYNPKPAILTPDQQKYITGVQANMWTEYVSTVNKLEYMLFPRVIAVAEVGWTAPENKNYANFATVRMPEFLNNIDKFGVTYRIPEAIVSISDDIKPGRNNILLTPAVAGSKIYYTIDGHKADLTGNLYTGPITTPFTNGRPLVLKYITVVPDGRVSNEFSVDIK